MGWIIVAALGAGVLAGLGLVLRGQRRVGAFWMAVCGGWMAVAWLIVTAPGPVDGFASARERDRARAEGVTDPEAWAAIRAERVAAAAALRAAHAAEGQALRELQRRRALHVQAAALADANLAEAERRRAGLHCLSPFTGAHDGVRDAVRLRLREPGSFEHDGTVIWPVDQDGAHLLIMRYRARNGFGGMSAGVARASVRGADCGFTLLAVE